ncbi:MAG TPA: hypothetical protein VFU47_08290, partial [Armatimonadota bacterium]|nr:hypothetical protein [Armatimonadota bacterium]
RWPRRAGSVMPQGVPSWLDAYLLYVMDALGLQVWVIEAVLTDAPNPEHPDADATTYADASYLVCRLQFRPECVAEESVGAKVLAIHELLHVQEAARDAALDEAVNHFVPKKHRPHAHETIRRANEERVVRLSRQLYSLLEPGWKRRKKEQKKEQKKERDR